MLEAALDLAYRGFAVFPVAWPLQPGVCSCLRAGCESVGKHPMAAGWQEMATKSFARVEGLWGRWPEANIGIATGAPSGVVVVDVDGPTGLASLRQKQAQARMQWPTLCARTARGWHLYYRDFSGAKNRVGVLPGVDIRATGGFVVAPPSVHASGEVYTWAKRLPIAEAPPWVHIDPPLPRQMRHGGRGGEFDPEPQFRAGEGQRNWALFRYVCRLIAEGLALHDVAGWAKRANQTRCSPPLPQREVDQIVASAGRHA